MEETTTYYIVLISFLMPLVLAGTLIWFVINYQKKKNRYEIDKRDQELREQKLIIDKQTALQNERNRIASEMHDDLGGGLTTIKFVSQRALRNIKNPQDKKLLEKISNQSTSLVNNMSEIIWAMNSGFDNLESLLGYIRRYSKEYLTDHEIKLDFRVDSKVEGIVISGEKRRHIFLVVKEALHNVVKHAKATKVEMITKVISNRIIIKVKDNGIGFDGSLNAFGHGIGNMKKRVDVLGGKLLISGESGSLIEFSIPIN